MISNIIKQYKIYIYHRRNTFKFVQKNNKTIDIITCQKKFVFFFFDIYNITSTFLISNNPNWTNMNEKLEQNDQLQH